MMVGLVPFNRKNRSVISASPENPFSMIDDFFNDSWIPRRNLTTDPFKVDVKETDNAYWVEAELPGVKKENINISINDDRLSISVNREANVVEEKDKDNSYNHRERGADSMQRPFI